MFGLVSVQAMADATRGLVTDVRGNVFVVRGEKTYPLRVGSQLQDFDEVMTETNALIGFSDYYGHNFFMSGSGHIKVYNRMIELKSGYLWLKNKKDQFDYSAQTANSILNYSEGEGILSFDPYAGKTQFLNIHGNFEFGNILQKEITTPVREGYFTYIDNELANGVPRRPTPIGYDSYKKIVGLFQGLNPAEAKDRSRFVRKQSAQTPQRTKQRSIASVPVVQEPEKMGTIKILENNSVPEAKQRSTVNNYLTSKMKKLKTEVDNRPWRPTYKKKSGVKIRVFGSRPARKRKKATKSMDYEPTRVNKNANSYRPSASTRAPASVNKTGFSAKKEQADPFEKSLMNGYKKQMRHSKEVNSLINDLKNYRQDYQISY